MTKTNLTATIDAYGTLSAQIAELTKQQKALKAALAELEAGRHEGDLFNLTVAEFTVEVTDWKAIAEKVGYSHQLKAAYTTDREDRRLTPKANTARILAA
jgi:hypothetical protein